jgi:hypothetical protein
VFIASLRKWRVKNKKINIAGTQSGSRRQVAPVIKQVSYRQNPGRMFTPQSVNYITVSVDADAIKCRKGLTGGQQQMTRPAGRISTRGRNFIQSARLNNRARN